MNRPKAFLSPMQTSLAFALLLLTACGSCIIGASRSTTEGTSSDAIPVQATPTQTSPSASGSDRSATSEKSPVIREDLVKALEKLVAQPEQAEGFGLFSEGGFSGAGSGQYMYLVDKNGNWLHWYSGGNGPAQSLGAFTKPSDQTAKNFAALAGKFDALSDSKATAFDAFSYTYIHLKKQGAEVTRTKVLNMHNLLSDRPESVPYNELIMTFRSSRSK